MGNNPHERAETPRCHNVFIFVSLAFGLLLGVVSTYSSVLASMNNPQAMTLSITCSPADGSGTLPNSFIRDFCKRLSDGLARYDVGRHSINATVSQVSAHSIVVNVEISGVRTEAVSRQYKLRIHDSGLVASMADALILPILKEIGAA
ncbi:MAG: hypothetical protein AAGI92_10225 [Pseudomonadota bacterium]